MDPLPDTPDTGANTGANTGTDAWIPALIVTAALLLVLLVVGILTRSSGFEAQLLAREGQTAEATVLDHRTVSTRRTDTDGRAWTDIDYYVTFGFTTADGQDTKVEVEVGQSRYRDFELGRKVPLRYAASRPDVIEFEAGEKAAEVRFLAWALWGLGAIAAGLSALTWTLWRRRSR
jgi:Protein of unknown function (DUF3592)